MNIQPFVLCKVNNNDLVNKSICKHTESSQNFSRAEKRSSGSANDEDLKHN